MGSSGNGFCIEFSLEKKIYPWNLTLPNARGKRGVTRYACTFEKALVGGG